MFPKHFYRAKYRKKFHRYYRFFFLSGAVFLLFLILELFCYGSGGYQMTGGEIAFERLFSNLFFGEGIWFLATYLLGITVYAPAFQLMSAALRGALSGFLLSSLIGELREGSGFVLFFLVLVYCLVSTQLFCCYASFCTTVSLRLFTDATLKRYPAVESRMFGGTLFHSQPFCNTVNLRFLFSYSMMLFLSLLLSSLLIASYSFFCSLIG